MKIRILGSGTSSGVPRIGGGGRGLDSGWGSCDQSDPRNYRTRASVLVSTLSTRILVDTSPDMRAQLLAAAVNDVDAVIWTHDHADHCHGIDDLRQLYHARGAPVAGYARPDTLAALERRFGYAFAGRGPYPPMVAGALLPNVVTIGDIVVRTVDQPHGDITSAGLRFESAGTAIGYSTDFHEFTPEMHGNFSGLDIWVVDALRRRPHPTHPHLAQVLQWIAELKPALAALVHMDESMDYATLAAELPAGIIPGYDGLELGE